MTIYLSLSEKRKVPKAYPDWSKPYEPFTDLASKQPKTIKVHIETELLLFIHGMTMRLSWGEPIEERNRCLFLIDRVPVFEMLTEDFLIKRFEGCILNNSTIAEAQHITEDFYRDLCTKYFTEWLNPDLPIRASSIVGTWFPTNKECISIHIHDC